MNHYKHLSLSECHCTA